MHRLIRFVALALVALAFYALATARPCGGGDLTMSYYSNGLLIPVEYYPEPGMIPKEFGDTFIKLVQNSFAARPPDAPQ